MKEELSTIQRAIAGDEAAMRSLWTRHAPHIDMVVRRLVGQDPDLAQDIAQDVWIQIFRVLLVSRGITVWNVGAPDRREPHAQRTPPDTPIGGDRNSDRRRLRGGGTGY